MNFSIYLPATSAGLAWGAAVTSLGFQRSLPGDRYPSPDTDHLADHLFDIKTGRVLNAWQIVWIQAGRGWFESATSGRQRLGPGASFLIFPDIWHRYAPDPDTGWTESWLEMTGPLPARLVREGSLDPKSPALSEGTFPDFEQAMEHCLQLGRNAGGRTSGVLSTAALQALALWIEAKNRRTSASDTHEDAIRRALELLASESAAPESIASIARSIGMAESTFRREFTRRIGVSPKRYLVNLRIRRVVAALTSTSATLEDLAERFGFSSAFHLSTAFKQHTGESPGSFRRKLREM